MNQAVTPTSGVAKKKKGFLGKLATFLMMGGWLLLLVVALALVVVVSMVFK